MFFGKTYYAWWVRQRALNELQAGAISDALRHLRRAARAFPNDGTIDLMRAFCFRQLRQVDRWRDAFNAAVKKNAAPEQLDREMLLYRIQTGDWPAEAELQLARLAGEGFTQYDVPAAYVDGYLASDRFDMAARILDAWEADSPGDAYVEFMRGRYWEARGDAERAQQHYDAAIAIQPRLELAHDALAKLFEKNDQLERALQQYASLAVTSPQSTIAAIGMARIYRKLGLLEQAEKRLQPLIDIDDVSPEVAAELATIAMQRHDLAGADRWFRVAGLADSRDPMLLMNALCLEGLKRNPVETERLYRRIARLGNAVARLEDLRIRLKLNPNDNTAAAEMRRLFESLDADPTRSEPPAAGTVATKARQLYDRHCSACHGPDGRGDGRAACHLFPFPRDLRMEPARLVSTDNGVPTLDDTVAVLRRGVPGTSMPSFDHLSDADLRMLAELVHEFRREGLREWFADAMRLNDVEVDKDALSALVAQRTTPGEPIAVPPIGPFDQESIDRGRSAFRRAGCVACHGEDGAGAVQQVWFDERGFPVRARDLIREPLKGGQDPTSVYLRIAAGMPGTPHPSSSSMPPESLIDLVQFCRSLSEEPKLFLTDHERALRATNQAYLAALKEEQQ